MPRASRPSPSAVPANALVKAFRTNDVKAFQEALQAGVPLDTRQAVFGDVFRCAAGRPEMVKIILAIHPADPGFESGWCSVASAASTGNSALVTLLLDAGHPVDEPDGSSRVALDWAALAGDVAMMEFLIDRGASTIRRDRYGRTALIAAVSGGNLSAVDFLLARGAQIHERTDLGHAALHIALLGMDMPIITALVDAGADLGGLVGHMLLAQKDPITPLMYAATKGNSRLLHLLVDRGASVTQATAFGRTALHFAAGAGHPEAVEILLNARADVRARLSNGDTALHLAAASNTPACVAQLLAAGADVSAKTNTGITPLHDALFNCKPDGNPENITCAQVVRLLLAAGADVNAQPPIAEGALSPLHLAARCGSEEIVILLLNAGANPDQRDANGHRPEDQGRTPAVTALLKSHRERALLRQVVDLPALGAQPAAPETPASTLLRRRKV